MQHIQILTGGAEMLCTYVKLYIHLYRCILHVRHWKTMNKRSFKAILVVMWIAIVFGFLWLLSFAYEKNQGFLLFICIAIAGNLAYDGLKMVVRYDPLFTTDAESVVLYVLGFAASLIGSVAIFIVGAELFVYSLTKEWVAQAVSGIGFLLCVAGGMLLLAKAERKFHGTNRAA